MARRATNYRPRDSQAAPPASLAERLAAWAPLLIAAITTLSICATLSPLSPGGPGVTCDEVYDVACGKRLVWGLEQYGLRLFTPPRIREIYGSQAQHPPLGRWILGLTQRCFDSQPHDLDVLSITAARFAPALAFGVNLWLIGVAARRNCSPAAGVAASLALALMPRAIGHAHLASLDTFTNLTCTAATLGLGWAVTRGARPTGLALAGALWGLAMLTKIQGVLLFVPLSAWMIWQLRGRAAARWPIWFGAGVSTYLAGWPWLWLNPPGHLREYLATTVQRVALHTFYVGQSWNDVDVPWHYPWVMTLATVPLGLALLACLGIVTHVRQFHSNPWASLVLVTLTFWLIVFSWPGVPVYDGIRLFLPAFSQLAICVGWGFDALWRRALARWPARGGARYAAAILFFSAQGSGLVVYRPFLLSYYSLAVGGLSGAERLGFEVTYWGDAVNGPLIAAALRNAQEASPQSPPPPEILLAPHLAPYQSSGLMLTYPELLRLDAQVVGWDPLRPTIARDARTLIVYHRRADLASVGPLLADAELLAETSRQGVWLARVYRIGEPLHDLRPRQATP